MALRIKEFPIDDQFWRIDGVGKVARNEDVDSEPKVHVLLSALKNDYKDPLNHLSRTGEIFTVWIGVGQLLKIGWGAVWRKKACIRVPSANEGTVKEKTFAIDTNAFIKTTFSKKINFLNQSLCCIPKKYYDVGNNYDYLKDTPLLVAPVKESSNALLILPAFVLLKSYYLSSSKVARAVFNDDRGELVSVDESFLLENGNCQLEHLKKSEDIDSWFLARWCSSSKTQEQITRMHQRIIADTVNLTNAEFSKGRGANIDIGFPFNGKSDLVVLGKSIKLAEADEEMQQKAVWGFLVTSIERCTHPMPYKDIVPLRKYDNRKGKNSNDPNLQEIDWGMSAQSDHSIENDFDLASEEEPSLLSPVTFDNFNGRFPDLIGKMLIRDPKLVQAFRAVEKHDAKLNEEAELYGTGAGTSGVTNTKPINIRENQTPIKNKLPPDIDTFFEVLKLIRLATKTKQWKITSIRVNERGWVTKFDDVLSCFPSNIKGCISWHLMTTKPILPRAVAIVKVETPASKVVYLLEMERKADAHCLLILRNEYFQTIHDQILDIFLCKTARNNGWPPSNSEYRLYVEKIQHHKSRTLSDFAAKILEKLY